VVVVVVVVVFVFMLAVLAPPHRIQVIREVGQQVGPLWVSLVDLLTQAHTACSLQLGRRSSRCLSLSCSTREGARVEEKVRAQPPLACLSSRGRASSEEALPFVSVAVSCRKCTNNQSAFLLLFSANNFATLLTERPAVQWLE